MGQRTRLALAAHTGILVVSSVRCCGGSDREIILRSQINLTNLYSFIF